MSEKVKELENQLTAKKEQGFRALELKDEEGARSILGEINDIKKQIADTKESEKVLADMRGELDAVTTIVKQIEEEPAIRNTAMVTSTGGTSDPDRKNFADWLTAVYRHDVKRLTQFYGSELDNSKEMKDMTEGVGVQGGFMVPEEFLSPILEIQFTMSPLLGMVKRVPVGSDHGRWPSLDYFTAPTAGSGNTAFASSITSAVTAEGATLTETQATLTELTYTVHKEGGFVEVSNELIQDSPQSIDTLLTSLFGITVASKKERNIIRGTGAGEALGVLNAASAIGITPATDNAFAYADALTMKSRHKVLLSTPAWLIHKGVWPDIGIFEVSSGSGGVWQANLSAALNQTIFGWPIIESEHSPQDDNAGNVILGDWAAYLLFERAALSIAFSDQAAFTADKGTWRFLTRYDGLPWMQSAITLADPQGSFTVSPFVFHND